MSDPERDAQIEREIEAAQQYAAEAQGEEIMMRAARIERELAGPDRRRVLQRLATMELNVEDQERRERIAVSFGPEEAPF